MGLLSPEHQAGIVDRSVHSTDRWSHLSYDQVAQLTESVLRDAAGGVLLDRGPRDPMLIVGDKTQGLVLTLNVAQPGRSSMFPCRGINSYMRAEKQRAKLAIELKQREIRQLLERMKRLEQKLRRERELAEKKRREELKRQQDAAAALKRERERRAAEEQKRRRAEFEKWMKELQHRRFMEMQIQQGMSRGR